MGCVFAATATHAAGECLPILVRLLHVLLGVLKTGPMVRRAATHQSHHRRCKHEVPTCTCIFCMCMSGYSTLFYYFRFITNLHTPYQALTW
ncbi:hypothetical protein HDV63DRAFT_17430 [Trichoderma sp. SZMC 28014]